MITNFEELTKELNEKEIAMVPSLIELLEETDISMPIKAPEICEMIEGLTQIRLRKMVNAIRSNACAPICATSAGYFLSKDKAVLDDQIKSMYERASSIKRAGEGLQVWIGQNVEVTQGSLF